MGANGKGRKMRGEHFTEPDGAVLSRDRKERPGPATTPRSLAVIFEGVRRNRTLGMSGATPERADSTSDPPKIRVAGKACDICRTRWIDVGHAAALPDCPFCGAKLGAREVEP